MQRTSFILGVALLVVAGTLAVAITFRRPAPASLSDNASSSAPAAGSSTARPRGSFQAGHDPSSAKATPRTSEPPRFSVSAPDDHPDRELLAERARKVEAEAQRQLERLTEQLMLTGEQRRRLFPILARTSEDYDPAMTISGHPAGAPRLTGWTGDREFNEVLEPPQRDQLIEDAMADAALWQEIIGKLQRRLDEQTPRVPAADPEAPAEPAPAPPRGRGNLFDTVEPEQ